jgi:hypothetical protein
MVVVVIADHRVIDGIEVRVQVTGVITKEQGRAASWNLQSHEWSLLTMTRI